MMLYLLLGMSVGMGIGIQTALNSRLRAFLGTPFLSSFVSFTVGTLFLVLIALAMGQNLLPTADVAAELSWWLWLGGVLGMIALTSNILLFPKLGGVQTAIFPLLGQVLMGLMIDGFGWFGSPQIAPAPLRFVGVGLIFIGIFCAVVIPGLKQTASTAQSAPKATTNMQGVWLWRLVGIAAGTLMATQTAINGELGRQLHSSVQAAMISFSVGMIGLFLVITLYERSLPRLKNGLGKDKPWWIWFGGIFGALFVFGSVILVPQIGTGSTVVVTLSGLIIGSLIVDNFGLFAAQRKPVTAIQLLGLAILIGGVALIQWQK